MVPEEINNNNKITPQVAEKKVSEAVDDVVLDDDFLIEEDGDFFWVIQRIVWGIIKTLFILVLIGGLIWLIWGGKVPFSGNEDLPPAPVVVTTPTVPETPEPKKDGWFAKLFSSSNEEKPAEKKPEPEVVTTQTPAPVITQEKTIVNNLNLESLSYQLSETNVAQSTNTTITATTSWLRQVKNVGDVSSDLLRLSAPERRAERIEETIRTSENLLNQSSVIQRALSEEFDFFFNKGQLANENTAQIDMNIAKALAQFRGQEVENLLNQKIIEQQKASANLSQAKVRQTLLQNVQNFDRLLRQKSIPLLRPTELRANPI